MSAATRQRKSNLYVDKREGSASLLSQRREVNLLYTVAKNSMFMLERQCYADTVEPPWATTSLKRPPNQNPNFFFFFVGTTGMPFRGKTVSANGLVQKTPGRTSTSHSPGDKNLYSWAGCERLRMTKSVQASLITVTSRVTPGACKRDMGLGTEQVVMGRYSQSTASLWFLLLLKNTFHSPQATSSGKCVGTWSDVSLVYSSQIFSTDMWPASDRTGNQ